MTIVGFRHRVDTNALRECADDGLTTEHAAVRLGVPKSVVRSVARTHDIELKKDRRGPLPKVTSPALPKGVTIDVAVMERNARMVLMFRQGLTLEKIGGSFGITRERVRQILRKLGIGPGEGGHHKTALSKAAARRTKQDARYLTRHGLTFAEYKEVHGTGLLGAYRNQENSAKSRGIDWDLNLAQWLDIWRTSGKLELRGRGKGKYVMSRIKDTGGYVVGNVHIQLATENSREAVQKWNGKKKALPGVFYLYPGLSRPYMAKVGKRCLGRFATEDDAQAARMDYMNANGYRLTPSGTAYRKPA